MRFYVEWQHSLLCALASESTCARLTVIQHLAQYVNGTPNSLWLSLQHPISFNFFCRVDSVESVWPICAALQFVCGISMIAYANPVRLLCVDLFPCPSHYCCCPKACGILQVFVETVLFVHLFPIYLFFFKFFFLASANSVSRKNKDKKKKHKNIVVQSQSELKSTAIFVYWYEWSIETIAITQYGFDANTIASLSPSNRTPPLRAKMKQRDFGHFIFASNTHTHAHQVLFVLRTNAPKAHKSWWVDVFAFAVIRTLISAECTSKWSNGFRFHLIQYPESERLSSFYC